MTSPTTTTGPPLTSPSAPAMRPASATFRSTRRMLTRRLSPAVRSWNRARMNGVTSLPATPPASAAVQRVGQHPVVQGGVHLLGLGQRVGHDDGLREAQAAPGALDRRDLLRRVHPPRHRVAGVGQVEAREAVGAEAEHRHGQGLQPLERGAHVEDRLHARRRPPRSARPPGRGGRPTRRRSSRPRGGRRRARRWRRPRSRPARPRTPCSPRWSPPRRRARGPAPGRARRAWRRPRARRSPPARRGRGPPAPRRRAPPPWPAPRPRRARPPRSRAPRAGCRGAGARGR